MTPSVRSASLTHFASVAAQHGLDAQSLVREVGLPVRCLEDPDLKVPAAAVGRVLELAAERSRDAAFALRMVESRRLSNLGTLGLLVRDEPTLCGALEVLVRHIHVHNEALVASVEPAGGNLVVIREDLAADGVASLRQAAELALGVTFRVLQLILGADWRPRVVCFSHRRPRDLSMHHRVFGPAVEFGHEFNGIVCNAADLDARNPAADPVMSRYSKQLLAREAPPARMSERVRQLVVVLLPRGHCSVETVAQHLGVDRRTVARRLLAEGATFSGLLDGVRTELVTRYLEDGARPLGEVGALLGFSAPSAFSRWHAARFGVAARTRAKRPRGFSSKAPTSPRR